MNKETLKLKFDFSLVLTITMKRSALTPLSALAAKQPRPDTDTLPLFQTARRTLGKQISPFTEVHSLFIDHFHGGNFVAKPIRVDNLFGAISFQIFGTEELQYVKAVEKFVEKHHKNEFATENVLVTAAYCLNCYIYVFREGFEKPTSKVSPFLLKEQTKEAYPGGLFLAFDLKTRSFLPVVAYNHENVKDINSEIRLRDKHGNLVIFSTTDIQENPESLRKLKERYEYSGEIKTGLSKITLKRFAGFIQQPNVFRAMTHLDSELYAFAVKNKVDKLRLRIRDAYLNEIHFLTLMRFLKENKVCDTAVLKHSHEVLQLMPLRELQTLSDCELEFKGKIDSLIRFRRFLRNRVVTFEEPFVVIELTMPYGTIFESEFYFNGWHEVPLNACLVDLFFFLNRRKQSHIVCEGTLFFVTNRSLGFINIFEPFEAAKYVNIPPGGPDCSEIQLCLSSANKVYLFDQASKLVAWVDNKYQISPWTKLHSDEYVNYSLSDFEVFDVECVNETSDTSVESERIVCQTKSGKVHTYLDGKDIFLISLCDGDDKTTDVSRENLLPVTLVKYPGNSYSNNGDEDELNFDSWNLYTEDDKNDDENSILLIVSKNTFLSYAKSLKER